jgi:NADH-quinone oxidoreductase subunit C
MSDNKDIVILKETFGEVILSVSENKGISAIVIDAAAVYKVVEFLKENLGYTFLTDLCGIHFPEQQLQLGIIYHLHNFQSNLRISVRTFVADDNPHVPSIIGLFSAANWMERETYDFYGIIFDGHPNLKRILNVEYLDYFPLRKEYPLEDPTREDKDDRFFGR